MKKTILICGVLALAGCVTPEEQQQRLAATCAGYGFKPGSTEMAQCMQNETLAMRQQQQRAAANLQALSQQYQPRTTTCNRLGQSVHCTTF